MADRPGAAVSAVNVLESAVQLLRRTPLSVLLYHWAGGVPFAVTVLLFWNDVSQYRTSAATCAVDAAAATLGLGWMLCWRALFAGQLRARLSGDVYRRASLRQLVSTQIFPGAVKLIAIPLGFATIIGFANLVAFFRFLPVLGGRPFEGDVFAMMAQSSRLARQQTGRSWIIMLAAWVLTVALFLNLTLVLMILPQLLRMLTGVETDFSHIGSGLVSTPLFWGVAFAVAWLAADPFFQAVYCVLCFRCESTSTGEDLRAGLRRLRTAATAATLLLAVCWVAGPLGAADAVGPGPLHDSIQQSLHSHEYDWRLPSDAPQAAKPGKLIQLMEKVLGFIGSVFKAIGRLIGKLIDWIFEKLSGVTPNSQGGQAPTAALHWSVYVLITVILLLAGLLIWRIVRGRNRKAKAAAATPIAAIRLDDDDVMADRLPEDEWIAMAEERLRAGDYRLALRAFYLANLAYLGRRELLTIAAGKTDREYENELRRRARGAVEARELFRANLDAFARVWYGLHDPDLGAVEEFRGRNRRIKQLIDPPAEAAA